MKFDYELIERVGATHYSTSHCELYKVNNGELMFWYNFGERWEATTKTKSEVLLLIKPIPPKPQTKVTYELVTDMDTNEIAKAMIDGEVFYSKDGEIEYIFDGGKFKNNKGAEWLVKTDYYRRVETEVDWIDAAKDSNPELHSGDGNLISMGVVGRSTFLEMCRAALRATGEL